jgi:hypothetical protein
MRSGTDQDLSLKALFEEKAQNLDDFNNEMAGREVGKINRFVADSAAPNGDSKKHRDRGHVDLHVSALDALRRNAEYEALYQQTLQFLSDLAGEAEATINDLSATLDALLKDQGTMLDAAPQLPDGRFVFEDNEGNVRDQHGQIIAELSADDINWPEDAPSFENWQELEARIDSTQARLEGWLDLRDNHIAPAQERMADEDNPLSMDEMKAILEDQQTRAEALRQAQPVAFEMDAPAIKAPVNLIVPNI